MRASSKLRALSLAALLVASARPASAHDLRIPVHDLVAGAGRIERTLTLLRRTPAVPPLPVTPDDQRRVLGAAEIELTLGHDRRALEMLMGRLVDPEFQKLPEHVETLLFTSQILETMDESAGAMMYAEEALKKGGTPDQMAEAGARWFRLARRDQRLGRRLEIYELWRSRGGERASGSDVAAKVAYEVAFALRADGRRGEARAMLGRVPSESSVGSRAAYLAGVTLVEEGDLSAAERWFSALMDWPLPALDPKDPEWLLESEVRELAALSTARLRYERGDLEGADAAYDQIPSGSRLEAEACWERAFLSLDKRERRGALKNVQCVIDLGASGGQFVDARLFRASLLAHLHRYEASIEAFVQLHEELARERDRFAEAAAGLASPAKVMFEAMERSAVDRGRSASPGPATLFGSAWTSQVDLAYRVDRGRSHAERELANILAEIESTAATLERPDAFVAFDVRRAHLERLMREVQHLLGHAGDLRDALRERHASTSGAGREFSGDHEDDARTLVAVIQELSRLEGSIEQDLVDLEREESERRSRALAMLVEIRAELGGLLAEAEALELEAGGPVDAVAAKAVRSVKKALADAAMRAEVGVLDTYWLHKEHRTQAIESLLQRKKEAEDQASEALRQAEEELSDDEALGPPPELYEPLPEPIPAGR
ncbi:hypothetical protein L6R52_39685 [Myxococcota bacterium]|nr:hypothetical protein [Myxococcota bacterium]